MPSGTPEIPSSRIRNRFLFLLPGISESRYLLEVEDTIIDKENFIIQLESVECTNGWLPHWVDFYVTELENIILDKGYQISKLENTSSMVGKKCLN